MNTNKQPVLPDRSFSEMACALRELVRREVRTDQQCEHYLARHPDEGLALTLRDLQRTTDRLADAYQLVSALASREAAVRNLFSSPSS